MSYLHFQYAVEIRRVLKQAKDGATRTELYDHMNVGDKSELKFGETLAELCQGRSPDVVMVKIDDEPSRYYLSAAAWAFIRSQELPSTHVAPNSRTLRVAETPKPKSMHVCVDCGADVVHTGKGRKPKRCPTCRAIHTPVKRCCPTCGHKLKKPLPQEPT